MMIFKQNTGKVVNLKEDTDVQRVSKKLFHVSCGSWFPDQKSSLTGKHRVIITEPPGYPRRKRDFNKGKGGITSWMLTELLLLQKHCRVEGGIGKLDLVPLLSLAL